MQIQARQGKTNLGKGTQALQGDARKIKAKQIKKRKARKI